MDYFKHYTAYLLIFFIFSNQKLLAYTISGKYPVQNFTPTEYRAGIQNIDFAQNRDMTLFVANNLGVLSYNGNSWQTHDFKSGKKKRSLVFDEQTNRLYVGSQGDFGFFSDTWQYTSLIDRIPEGYTDFDEVWDVFLFNSHVYFCTFQHIYEYDGQSLTVIGPSGSLERSFLVNGKLFTQSQQGTLFEIDGQELIQVSPEIRTGQAIAGMIPEEEGYLLFYKSGEIEFTTSFGKSHKYDNLIQALKGTYVNHVLQLSDTRLVISTQTSGLFLYDPQEGTLETINTQDGLGSNACLRAFQDYSGNLWVGMQNGIALIYINSPMRLINREIALPGSGYEAYEATTGTYFTTSNGIYFLANGSTKSIFLSGTEGPAYGMQEIAGNIYAGHHTGLFLLEGDRAHRIAQTDGLWQIKQLRSNPSYAIGGTYSGLFLFTLDGNQQLRPVQRMGGFNASSRFFEEDPLGNIWVSQYYKGLYQLKLSDDFTQASVNNVSENSEFPISEQIILSRVNDHLYLATYSGLYQIDPNQEKVVDAGLFSQQIGTQPVYLFEQDRKNNIHIVTENTAGFFRQISAENYKFIPSSLYQLRYHLNNDLLHVSANTSRGILFSANEGFIHYDPELEDPFNIEYPLMVSRVFSVNENKALYQRKPFENPPDTLGSISVSPNARVLKIDVELFQFNDLENQQFRYYLEGLDEGYGEWTPMTTKEYTNLREGDYAFSAQTRNYRGETVTAPTLHLVVTPPFYRSQVAKYLFTLLGFTGLFLVYRLQRRRFVQKAQTIEESKKMELAQKQKKLLEVKQQKERELLQLKEEQVQSELRHVNNLLAASTMNLVVKNEFIESIKEELKALKQKGKNQETKRALEKIVKEIDITLRIQEDWEQFEHHFDQIHRDFLTRLQNDYPDLSPNEQKLCTFLRLNLNTKEIANLLNISLRGVEVARYRLRKKLGLTKGENLSKFILEY